MPIVKSLKKKFGISAPRVAARAVEYQELQAKAKVSGDMYIPCRGNSTRGDY
ncbi:MAG: hypothetical protein H0Z20_03825 [Nitrosospira sp.]|nr:hypothetical protein [Nitrosospira sp.]MDW7598822.1 hypothetical protein [Nitrosomonadaceae bacterium]